jgi:hypothetical protein
MYSQKFHIKIFFTSIKRKEEMKEFQKWLESKRWLYETEEFVKQKENVVVLHFGSEIAMNKAIELISDNFTYIIPNIFTIED